MIRLIPVAQVVNNQLQYTATWTVKFTRLISRDLNSFPVLIGYILAHVGVHSIDSFKIRAQFSPCEVKLFFNSTFGSAVLKLSGIGNLARREIMGFMIHEVEIGEIHSQFDFYQDKETSETIMGCILPLVHCL